MYYVINFNTREVLFMNSDLIFCEKWVNKNYPNNYNIVLCKAVK